MCICLVGSFCPHIPQSIILHRCVSIQSWVWYKSVSMTEFVSECALSSVFSVRVAFLVFCETCLWQNERLWQLLADWRSVWLRSVWGEQMVESVSGFRFNTFQPGAVTEISATHTLMHFHIYINILLLSGSILTPKGFSPLYPSF